jgi:hypothetical protein
VEFPRARDTGACDAELGTLQGQRARHRVEHQHALAEPRERRVVVRDDDRRAIRILVVSLAQQLGDLARGRSIEARCRFVAEQQLWRRRERACNGEPLPHAARELRRAFGRIDEPRLRQQARRQQHRTVRGAQRELHVRSWTQLVEQAFVLQDRRDLVAGCGSVSGQRFPAGDQLSGQPRSRLARFDEPGQYAQQRRLAAAARADEQVEPVRDQRQRHALEQHFLGAWPAVRETEVAELEGR